jgi:AmmeMemoRadiSam system protein A
MYEDLLKLARETLETKLKNKEIKVSDSIKKKYSKKGACFVTLTIGGELRGCIGSLEAYQELWKDVLQNSINAGFHDPRFNPISLNELDKIKIEISILTPSKRLGIGKEVYKKIDNKMGIVLRKGLRGATFLPQVWEQLPSKNEFLEHLSQKAGLDKDDWKLSEISYYRVESAEEK